MFPKGVTNTTAVLAGDKDLHGPRVSPLLDVALTAVAESLRVGLLSSLQSFFACELLADESECVHGFGSCFYNSMFGFVWAQRKTPAKQQEPLDAC